MTRKLTASEEGSMRSTAESVVMVRPTVRLLAMALVAAVAWSPTAVAQSGTRALAIDDYERWRSIEFHRSAAISSDGAWVAYVFRYPDALDQRPVLHVRSLDSEIDHEIPNATGPVFSDDSRWVTAFVEPPYEEAKALRDESKPVPRQGLLLDLQTGARGTWEGTVKLRTRRSAPGELRPRAALPQAVTTSPQVPKARPRSIR